MRKDSTKIHIQKVKNFIYFIIEALKKRTDTHDQTLLDNPNEPDEQHYIYNSHHPEHFENDFSKMNVVDIIDMLADWKADAKNNTNSEIIKIIIQKKIKYGFSNELKNILVNTALKYL